MWATELELQAGRQTHRLVGLALTGAIESPGGLVDAARVMFRAGALGGTVPAGIRIACTSRAATYLERARPEGWELLGVEVVLSGAVADLVWACPAAVVIDEIKSGSTRSTDRRIASQVARLGAGGRAAYGEMFAGVRVVPLSAPRSAWFVDAHGRPASLATLHGLEVR